MTGPEPGPDGLWAVVIGIDDYPGQSSDLASAKADTREVLTMLDRAGVPFEQRAVLLDGDATAGNIARALDWLVEHAGADATAVVFYAGHVRKLGPGRETIVAADGAQVTDQEVAAHLERLRAARTWLIFATCYGAGFDEALRPGRILTAAAGADDLAYENPQMGRSYLVEYMIRRAFNQGRANTVEGAFAWARKALERERPDRVPVQDDRYEGDMPVRNEPPAPTPSGSCGVPIPGVISCRHEP
jgi:hypothetical protein